MLGRYDVRIFPPLKLRRTRVKSKNIIFTNDNFFIPIPSDQHVYAESMLLMSCSEQGLKD